VTTGESSYFTSKNDDNQSDSNAVEKSYQSKTTIRRTGQGGLQNIIINCTILTTVKLATREPLPTLISPPPGVRIIIDIFFDKKESEIDIVGSRVETDIPESRILTDFQQHSLAMNNQEQKPGVQEGPSTPST